MVFPETQLRRILLTLLIAIAGYWVLSVVWQSLQFFSDTLMLFFIAWMISFVLSPIANWLQRRTQMPRVAAALLVYLAVAVCMVGTITLTIPLISDQVGQVADRVTALTTPTNLKQLNANLVAWLHNFSMSDHDAHRLIDQLSGDGRQWLNATVIHVLANTATLLSSIASIVLNVMIALVLSFYMVLDGRRIMNRLTQRLPESWLCHANAVEEHVTRVFGGFIRGQLLISCACGVVTWASLVALGMANGLVISVFAGILMIIPFAGPYLALLPPLALVLIEIAPADLPRTLLILALVLIVAQQVILQVVAPRIMSQSVGLHPLWIFAALLVGAKEAGVLGAFFAAPIAALVGVLVGEIYDRWSATSPLFEQELGKTDDVPPMDITHTVKAARRRIG